MSSFWSSDSISLSLLFMSSPKRCSQGAGDFLSCRGRRDQGRRRPKALNFLAKGHSPRPLGLQRGPMPPGLARDLRDPYRCILETWKSSLGNTAQKHSKPRPAPVAKGTTQSTHAYPHPRVHDPRTFLSQQLLGLLGEIHFRLVFDRDVKLRKGCSIQTQTTTKRSITTSRVNIAVVTFNITVSIMNLCRCCRHCHLHHGRHYLFHAIFITSSSREHDPCLAHAVTHGTQVGESTSRRVIRRKPLASSQTSHISAIRRKESKYVSWPLHARKQLPAGPLGGVANLRGVLFS